MMRSRLENAAREMTFNPEVVTEANRNVVTPPKTLFGMARKTPCEAGVSRGGDAR